MNSDLFAIFPFAFSLVSVAENEDTMAFSFAIGERTNVAVAICKLKGALSVLHVIFPLTVVEIAVWILFDAMSVSLIIFPLTVVDVAF